jgi:hypothetical protein
MVRSGAVIVVFAVLLSLGAGAEMPPEDLLVANNSEIAFIDANDNGMRDSDDCMLNATMKSDGSDLIINGTQTDTPNKLVVCSGMCYGSAFRSSDYAEVGIESCQYAGGPFVPLLADFCDSDECTSSDTAHSGTAAGNGPLLIRSGAIFRTFFGLELAGSGVVCNAGGPAAQIVDFDGRTVLRDLVPFPDALNPTHMCANNVPVQLVSGGFVLRTACFPVKDGASPLALSGDPDNPLAIIDFENLASCPGRASRAPTASEWGLFALVLSLLVGGTWMLSRRARFAASLPLA